MDNNPPTPPSLSFSQIKRALHVGQSGPPTRKQKITHHTDALHTDLIDAHESIESIPTGPLPSNAGQEALANQRPIEPRSQADILSKHPKLRAPSLDPLALLALLARANDPEPYKPKTYKQAVESREEKNWRGQCRKKLTLSTKMIPGSSPSCPRTAKPCEANRFTKSNEARLARFFVTRLDG